MTAERLAAYALAASEQIVDDLEAEYWAAVDAIALEVGWSKHAVVAAAVAWRPAMPPAEAIRCCVIAYFRAQAAWADGDIRAERKTPAWFFMPDIQ